jgi:hypothetical protein
MAMKKLTDKQIAKIREIAENAGFADTDFLFDKSKVKESRKAFAAQLKATDKILAILCPPAKAKE